MENAQYQSMEFLCVPVIKHSDWYLKAKVLHIYYQRHTVALVKQEDNDLGSIRPFVCGSLSTQKRFSSVFTVFKKPL